MNKIYTLLLSTLTVLTAQSQVLTDGLIGYYPLDGNANDLSGLGLHGTVVGAIPAAGINGIPNTCYDFTNGVIEIDHLFTFPDSALTLSAWIYIDSIGIDSPREIYFANTDSNLAGSWYDPIGPSWRIVAQGQEYIPEFYALFTPSVIGKDTLKRNRWNHLIFEHLKDTSYIYVNNKLVATEGNGVFRSQDTVVRAVIGNWFKGRIDELMTFDRILNTSEKTLLFNQRTSGSLTTEKVESRNLNISYSRANKEITTTLLYNVLFQVYSVFGTIVAEEYNSNLSLATLSPGTYIVKVTSGTTVLSKTIVIH